MTVVEGTLASVYLHLVWACVAVLRPLGTVS
jgi:hypothetical protein